MEVTIRRLAAAIALASAVRAVVASALYGALALASPSLAIDGFGERLFAASAPIVAALGAWVIAPAWARWTAGLSSQLADHRPLSTRSAFVLVGAAAIVLPLVWVVTGWGLLALRMVALQSWDEGRRFLAPDYYSFLVVTWGPWLLAGAVLLALARHAPAE